MNNLMWGKKHSRDWKKRSLIYVAAVMPMIGVLIAVLKLGVNSPYLDEFVNLQYFRYCRENGLDLIRALSVYDNEHWIALPVLEQSFLWWMSDCNDHFVLIVSLFLLTIACLLTMKYIVKTGFDLVAILPLAGLFFTTKFAFIYFWPSCNMQNIFIFCAICSFYFYCKNLQKNTAKNIVLCLAFAMGATMSMASGIVIWPCFFAMFILQVIGKDKKLWKSTLIWHLPFFLLGICFSVNFAHHYYGSTLETTRSVGLFLKLLLANIMNFMLPEEAGFDTSVLHIAAVMGGMVLAIIIVSGVYLLLNGYLKKYAFPILIVMFFGGGVVCQVYGRMGAVNILKSQYALMPTLFLAGGYILICGVVRESNILKRKSFKQYILWFLYTFLLLISAASGESFFARATFHQANAYTVQNYEKVPDWLFEKYIGDLKNREILDWAKENKLFLFGSDRTYKYPYDDFYMAEAQEPFLPDTHIEVGKWYVDSVNHINPNQENIELTAGKGFDIEGWAVDNGAMSLPSAVWIVLDGHYYKMKPKTRVDVANYLENSTLTESGFIGYIYPEGLTAGNYPLELVVVSCDGTCYYSDIVCDVIVQ